MPSDPNQIGEAHVSITGSADDLGAVVDEAKQEVEELGNKAEEAGSKVENSSRKGEKGFKAFSGSVSSAVGSVTGLLGVITLIGGALAGAILKIKQWEDAQREAKKETKSLTRDIKDLRTAFVESVDDVDAATAPLRERADALREVSREAGNAMRQEIILAEIRLRKQAELIEANDRERESRARRQQDANRELLEIRGAHTALERLIAETNLELLPPEDQIRARFQVMIDEAQRLANIGEGENAENLFGRFKSIIEERMRIEIEAHRALQSEQKKADAERADAFAKRMAKATAREMDRELRPIIDSLNIQIGGDFGNLGQLVSALQENSTALRQRR